MQSIDAINHIRQLGWSITALSQRWGISRRYLHVVLADKGRSMRWDDAFRGLALGPGLYRRAASVDAEALVDADVNCRGASIDDLPELGALVASEGDLESILFGDRGVCFDSRVTEERNEAHVFWESGTTMWLGSCDLRDWVIELGFSIPLASEFVSMPAQNRLEFVKKIDLRSV